jgi:hypothetical protein
LEFIETELRSNHLSNTGKLSAFADLLRTKQVWKSFFCKKMGVQYLELRRMIDSALGHPEKGIVNLNILHSLLHEILNHLDTKTAKENNATKDVLKDETDHISEPKQDNPLLSESDGQTTQDNCDVVKSSKNSQR